MNKPTENSKLTLGVEEVAQKLSITPWAVRRMVADGRLKATRFSRRVLIEPSEIERLIREGYKEAERD